MSDAPCALCAGATRSLFYATYGYRYAVCTSCGFIALDAAHKLDEARERALYDGHENHIGDPRYEACFMRFLKAAVFPYAGAGRRALDFGSGPAPVLANMLARDHGYDVALYDLYYARDTAPLHARYDVVTCTEVLEHMQDPLQTFARLASLLEPDGLLAVSTAFHPQDDEKFLGWQYMRDRSHVSFYTPHAVHEAARRTGLRVVFCDEAHYAALRLTSDMDIIGTNGA